MHRLTTCAIVAVVTLLLTAPQTAAQAAPQPTTGFDNGFFVQSADGANRLVFGVIVQMDGRFSLDDPAPFTNTFLLRKARPTVSGRVARHFDFKLMPDFGNGTTVLLDAYFDTRFSNSFRVRVGKDKTPVGYELLMGDAFLYFPERALASSLVPNRDVGVQALGDLAGGRMSYSGGVFNGVPDGANSTTDLDSNGAKDVAGRITVQPFRSAGRPGGALGGFGFHLGASTGREAAALPAYRTSAAQTYFSYAAGSAGNGTRTRVSPAVFYYHAAFGAFAEYVRSTQRDRPRRGDARHHQRWLGSDRGIHVDRRDGIRPRRPAAQRFRSAVAPLGRGAGARQVFGTARRRGGLLERPGGGGRQPHGGAVDRRGQLVCHAGHQVVRDGRTRRVRWRRRWRAAGRGHHSVSGAIRILSHGGSAARHPPCGSRALASAARHAPAVVYVAIEVCMRRIASVLARSVFVAVVALAAGSCGGNSSQAPAQGAAAPLELLNVSYDPTRELYKEFNAGFLEYWKAKSGKDVTVRQSHAGSGAQARGVIDGLEADIVTLALAYDIDAIAQSGLIATGWQKRLPENSAPYTSTIVFLVRKGNPKGIKDWGDLVKPGVGVIPANPKTSGGARWTYLAAYGQALLTSNNDDAKARAFVAAMYKNAPVLDSGARSATTTFVQRGIGDVLVGWENEAYLAVAEAKGAVEVIVPSQSILAEPPVAVVDKVVEKKGTREVAEAYLQYLYTAGGQEIAAKNHYRPRDAQVAAKYATTFAETKLFTIDQLFGGWTMAQKTHFVDGGVFDQIYQPGQ